MTLESTANLVETLSAQPLVAGDWLQRLQLAGHILLGGGALALVARVDRDACALAGFVDEAGRVIVRGPDRIEDGRLAGIRLSLPDRARPAMIPLDDAGAGALRGATRGLLLPWALGTTCRYALLVMPGDPDRLERASAEECWSFLAVAGNLLRRTERHALIDAGAWIEDQLQKLAQLQNLLKPVELAAVGGATFAVHSRPHTFAGGDYYDISVERDAAAGAICTIYVADVSGHGPAAVVETAMIDSILRTYSDFAAEERDPGPASVLNYLNRHMFTRQPRPSFATMFAASWRPGDRTLRYAAAGHPPPLLRTSRTGEVKPVDVGEGIPLQVLRDYRWGEQRLDIERGDVLVAYTDGVTEALSPGGAQFGERRLRAAIAQAPPEPDAIVAAVDEALATHAAGRAFHDDQTLVVASFP